MCTICGHFVREGSRPSNDIYDMLKKMEHRGPDTHGVFLDGQSSRADQLDDLEERLLSPSHIAMGHSRLAIVGRDTMTQPLTSCDGALTLIHNGEIYNFEDLRSLLMRHHSFRSGSDSEVIVHLLEETYEGDLLEAVRKVGSLLDGMFALAVTDGTSMVVARDAIGKKPVYYLEVDGVTYFASEKKALWNGSDQPTRLNPGQLLELTPERTKVHEGYGLHLPQIDIVNFREAVEMYKHALVEAVRKRLTALSESDLGVIFSGGIDSVLVATLLQREGQKVICYCTGTEKSGDIQAARSVARDLGLDLKTTVIDEGKVEALLPEIIANVEESGLLQVEVAIPMYLAAKLAGEDGIRVMYSGQAADELWAGYPWYNDVLSEHGYLRLHEKLWEDMGYLYSDTLEREDKLAMAHSIELRVPYLDREVIHVAMRVSPRLKLRGPEDQMRKRVHRQAAVELGVPPYLAFRKKDPAQSGSGIHGILQRVARKRLGHPDDAELAELNLERDKGSLYRYGEAEYGEEMTRAFLQRIEHDIQQRFIPEFLATA